MSYQGICTRTSMCNHLKQDTLDAQWITKKITGRMYVQAIGSLATVGTDQETYHVFLYRGTAKGSMTIRYCPHCGHKPGIAADLPDYDADHDPVADEELHEAAIVAAHKAAFSTKPHTPSLPEPPGPKEPIFYDYKKIFGPERHPTTRELHRDNEQEPYK
jgi:hypothetical protein